MIPEQLLRRYGARLVALDKGEFLFHEGDAAGEFFIVRQGHIRMGNLSEEGKEFVQGHFTDGQSFGEPPFFNRLPYPAFAVADSRTEVWAVRRDDFLRLLRENFEVHLEITRTLGMRLIYKSMMLSEIAIEEAEHRVRSLLVYLRESMGVPGETFTVPFSRQQLADMTGLRVETVIRTVKSLEQKKYLEISSEGRIRLD